MSTTAVPEQAQSWIGQKLTRGHTNIGAMNWGMWALRLYLVLMFAFLVVPSMVVAISSVSTTKYLTFPPIGFTLDWYEKFFTDVGFMSSLRVSLSLGLEAVAVAMILGTMAGVAITRYNFPGRTQIQLLLVSPLIIPQLVVGIAILQFFAQLGIARGYLLLLIGHVIITAPYVTRSVISALAGYGQSLEEAAMNLGASPIRAFVEVTIPSIKAGLLGAGIFAFLSSFSNLTMSVFIGGPRDATLPVRLWSYIEYNYDPVITTISTVILVITIVLLIILARVASLEKLF